MKGTKMKKLAKTDQADLSVSTEVEKRIVAFNHTVKPDEESPVRYQLHWRLDFSDLPMEDLLKLAARTVRIRLQQDWRKAKDKMDESKWDNRTFNVKAVLASTRQAASPLEKSEALVQKMSAEEKAALMEMLTKQMAE